jgi:arylsulfatase A-like enzyme
MFRNQAPSIRSSQIVSLLAFSLLLACTSESESPAGSEGLPPNLVLITLDTTRADHLGAYGYFRDTSPRLDEFAKEALLFERCITPMATTLPTHLSMLTGTYPLEHGVMANSIKGGKQYIMSNALTSLAECLTEAGYRTGGFVSGSPLNEGTGAARGYQEFGQPEGKDRHSEETIGEALDWLGQSQEQPYHLWVHMFDAHWPFHPPEEYIGHYQTDVDLERFIADRGIHESTIRPLIELREPSRGMTNAYDDALRYQDDQFGRLLDAMRERPDWDRTVVVVIGDHGEGLGQHGQAAHGHIWDEQLRVPLLIRFPGEAGAVNGSTLSTVDVLPTLLGQLDMPFTKVIQEQASGKDVLAKGFKRAPVFSQETGRSREREAYRFTLTDDRWKYVREERKDETFEEQLFDLQEDPFELTNVSKRRTRITDQFRVGLVRLRQLQSARAKALHAEGQAKTRPIDTETQRNLRALGYVDEAGE